jgi:7-carboxy-7-deazaguanine synthase
MTGLPTLSADKQQRLAPLKGLEPGQLDDHEIYRSIQGETAYAGLPCVFVRLTGCHLRCVWCDTPHAFTQGKRVTRAEVVKKVLDFDCPLVELTGGEPLLQPDAFPLMTELADAGKTVLLETSGANDIAAVDSRVHVVMDLKCPASGESESNYWPNLAHLKPTDEIKFVIASRRDWDWTVDTVRRHTLDQRFKLLVSGVFGTVPNEELVRWLLDSGLDARFQLQLHKYVWEPKARGV